MKLVIFGLSVSSSWGNGHATLWRGILRALAKWRHRVVFFERDVPYYAAHRDLHELPGGELILYSSWEEARSIAARHLDDADAAMVTSYCPDGARASDLCLASSVPIKTFYDLDTPITLERLRAGEPVTYLPAEGLSGFDLVLSFTGGPALDELTSRLGARAVAPLYGSVDPEAHRPVAPRADQRADLSYLGTYAADRRRALEDLFIEPARALPERRFLLGGSLYPADFPWVNNVTYIAHVPPPQHPAFYAASRVTLNVTRGPMAAMGYCPSGRLFEAAACGAPILSDDWPGLSDFFCPGSEILVARTTRDVIDALSMTDEVLAVIARAARERALDEHTSEHRARQLLELLARTKSTASNEEARS
jgi:spore maturation protein CgeB